MPSKNSRQTAAQADAKTQAPAKKRKADASHVLLPPKMRERIESASAQLEKEHGFDLNFTQAVLSLLDTALKELEEERAKAPPPQLPKDRNF